jgi:2'-5' RNA ligase
MRSHFEAPECGSIALVSYIPDPLGTLLHDLGRLLPGDRNPQPHVTILPPRPLRAAVQTASHEAQQILQKFPAFDVELTRVRHFPQTNMLYLEVGDGGPSLHGLHDALNTGNLQYVERFEFLPHLTLGGPIPAYSLSTAQQLVESIWKSMSRPARFSLNEIVCLWLSPGAAWGDWQRLWTQSLGHDKRSERDRAVRATATSRTY